MHSICQLLYLHAMARAVTCGLGRYSCKLVDVESHVTAGQFTCLVAEKATTGETKEILIVVPVCEKTVIKSLCIRSMNYRLTWFPLLAGGHCSDLLLGSAGIAY